MFFEYFAFQRKAATITEKAEFPEGKDAQPLFLLYATFRV